jgi:HEAT repeat protein
MVNLYLNIIEYLKNAPTIIQLSWFLSAGFFLTIMILVSYLKYLRSRLRTKGRIEATYQKKYESDLIEYLYSGNEEEISVQQQQIVNYLKKCAVSSLKRKIIIKTLLKLRNEISGEIADAIQKLYYQTDFITQASSKLKHKKWDVVARAIKELAQFEIKEVHDEVLVHINHPKKEVRRESQMYLVKLFSFNGLEFLDVLKTQLSEWNQIQILEILQKSETHKLPDITHWLKSPNHSVISFAIKLAKIYNQFEAKDEIIELFEHPNKEIRIQAIEIVSHLGIFEAIEILKSNINEKSLDEQITFFNMGVKMFTPVDIPFIIEYLDHENFEIRVSAQKALEIIGPQDPNTIQIDRIKKNNSNNTSLIKAS